MGRPFDEELNLLPITYQWALNADIEQLVRIVGRVSHQALRAVGSGGSLSAATLAAELHQTLSTQVASAVTPLDMSFNRSVARNSASLLLSSSGKNPDIIGVLKSIASSSATEIAVICTQLQSPLAQVASELPAVALCEFGLPSGRDGFLATNSLLALCVLLLRAYERSHYLTLGLPQDFETLLSYCNSSESMHDEQADPFAHLWNRSTTILLHGTSSQSAAADIESKLTEAALASVQVSDYRNFAHGRHHWLAKRSETSGVLALITDDDRAIAERTLQLIPGHVPVVRVDASKSGIIADLALLACGMFITRSAGIARSIDPGRPQVPEFGRRLYRLNAYARSKRVVPKLSPKELHAIEHKSGKSAALLEDTHTLSDWREAYQSFTQRIRETGYSSLAIDYDGTLCETNTRLLGISGPVVAHLDRLLRHGVAIGVATGRGQSVRVDLQNKLPVETWDQVTIGYYNGAEIGILSDNGAPNADQTLDDDLLPLSEALLRRTDIVNRAKLTFRKHQIAVEPTGYEPVSVLWERVQEIVQSLGIDGVSVLRSGHSIDILAYGVSKLNVVEHLARDARQDAGATLCVGDRGRWPGNDFFLLSQPYSLSVDEVSLDPSNCWKLAPPESLGVGALDYYLSKVRLGKLGGFSLDLH